MTYRGWEITRAYGFSDNIALHKSPLAEAEVYNTLEAELEAELELIRAAQEPLDRAEAAILKRLIAIREGSPE